MRSDCDDGVNHSGQSMGLHSAAFAHGGRGRPVLALIRIIAACVMTWCAIALALIALWRHGPGTAVCAWIAMQGLAGLLMPDMPDEGA